MSTSIDQAFVKQFESEVHLAYQRMGSKLRNTIRTKDNVKGASTTFQKAGKGRMGEKARHGDVPLMNIDHSNVEVVLSDHYAGEYVDKLDELKINHDERKVATDSGAAAAGRKTDEIILTALDATANVNNVAVATTYADATKPIALMEAFGKADVPIGDGNCFHAVSWQCWGDLLQINEFSNLDFVGMDNLPFKSFVQTKEWLGFFWFPHSGLPTDANGDIKQFAYHRSAAGHAIGADIGSTWSWENAKQANLVVYSLSQGAKIIDDTAVIETLYDVTP